MCKRVIWSKSFLIFSGWGSISPFRVFLASPPLGLQDTSESPYYYYYYKLHFYALSCKKNVAFSGGKVLLEGWENFLRGKKEQTMVVRK